MACAIDTRAKKLDRGFDGGRMKIDQATVMVNYLGFSSRWAHMEGRKGHVIDGINLSHSVWNV